LEDIIVPLFYERSDQGLPLDWLKVVKEAIRSIAPAFSATRMVKEYAQQMYLPSITGPEAMGE
jgi:starch phosphorylase